MVGGKHEPYREPGQEKKAGKEVTGLGGDTWKCLGREKCTARSWWRIPGCTQDQRHSLGAAYLSFPPT